MNKKYKALTSIQDVKTGDIVHRAVHNGYVACVVAEINYNNSTVYAPYKTIFDKYGPEFDKCWSTLEECFIKR